MYPSKYNILEPLDVPFDSFTHVVLNSFTGSTDLLDEPAAYALEFPHVACKDQRYSSILDLLESRGYLFENREVEKKKVTSSARAASETYLRDTLLFVIITTYACNLNCSYCFQGSRCNLPSGLMTETQIITCLDTIKKLAEEKNKSRIQIDLIGGEPLLPNNKSKKLISTFMDECTARDIWVNVVTNGTFLNEYCEMFAEKTIQYVQVTIDGPRDYHNSIRSGKNIDSFSRIINSVRKALELNIPIAARTNISLDSVSVLGDLAEIYQKNGFSKYSHFFPYIQPIKDNSCLSCLPAEQEDLILSKVLNSCQKDTRIANTFSLNNFVAFRYVMNALKSKRAPVPRFYRCEANIGQYVFDVAGDIYACLEAAGNPEFKIGRYEPLFHLDSDGLNQWRKRNVIDIKECTNCCVSFVCAGGCTWHNGSRGLDFLLPNCSEEVEAGIRLLLKRYTHEILKPDEKNDNIFNIIWKKLRR